MWEAFSAEETEDKGDGREECQAVLYYPKDLAACTPASKIVEVGDIVGTTGQGHAEMNAITESIRKFCMTGDAATLEQRALLLKSYCDSGQLSIKCTAKPCCVKCSAALGALNFSPITDHSGGDVSHTRKTRKTMGSTQWGGLMPDVRGIIAQYLAISLESFEELSNQFKMSEKSTGGASKKSRAK
ncbi:MAG: hypothetical protein ACREFP_24065 [Acetobacteraceae bacterium]